MATFGDRVTETCLTGVQAIARKNQTKKRGNPQKKFSIRRQGEFPPGAEEGKASEMQQNRQKRTPRNTLQNNQIEKERRTGHTEHSGEFLYKRRTKAQKWRFRD